MCSCHTGGQGVWLLVQWLDAWHMAWHVHGGASQGFLAALAFEVVVVNVSRLSEKPLSTCHLLRSNSKVSPKVPVVNRVVWHVTQLSGMNQPAGKF